MDKLDRLILSELFKDAQMSFVKIAKKLGTTPYTIRKRYEKMKTKGIIEGCVVGVDLSKLGYQGKAFVCVSLYHGEDKLETVSEILKIQNVFAANELVSPYDILVMAAVTDVNSVRKIINKIKNLPKVQQVEMVLINDTSFPIHSSYGEILSRKILEV
ncbi:MAG: Lrp/AsnC family transcriptional regulator [Candidatus Bathyarchaeota archaeon]|nr:Lrp/AsnC family transcriptional regulator [Candidatus Bathyarchaeum sp.]